MIMYSNRRVAGVEFTERNRSAGIFEHLEKHFTLSLISTCLLFTLRLRLS